MQLTKETLDKFEEYLETLNKLIMIISTYLHAAYTATTQIKSYAITNNLKALMRYPEKESPPLSLLALTQLIAERYKIIQKFNANIKAPTIPIPLTRDSLIVIVNELLEVKFEQSTAHINYSKKSKKITLVFREILEGRHTDYFFIEMCNAQYSLITPKDGTCRNQYEHSINNLIELLDLKEVYKETSNFDNTKFYFIKNMIQAQNQVLKYLIDFTIHHYRLVVNLWTIINAAALGFQNTNSLSQKANSSIILQAKKATSPAPIKKTPELGQVTEKAATLTAEQIKERVKHLNLKFEEITLHYDELIQKFPAFNPLDASDEEQSFPANSASKELQHQSMPSLLNEFLIDASRWFDRIDKVAKKGNQSILGLDAEAALLNAITYNYSSNLTESMALINKISEIHSSLKQMDIYPSGTEDEIPNADKKNLLSAGKNAIVNGSGANSAIPKKSSSDPSSFLHTVTATLSASAAAFNVSKTQASAATKPRKTSVGDSSETPFNSSEVAPLVAGNNGSKSPAPGNT